MPRCCDHIATYILDSCISFGGKQRRQSLLHRIALLLLLEVALLVLVVLFWEDDA